MMAAATRPPGMAIMPADEALVVDAAAVAGAVPNAPETAEVTAEAAAFLAERATDSSEATAPVFVPDPVAIPIWREQRCTSFRFNRAPSKRNAPVPVAATVPFDSVASPVALPVALAPAWMLLVVVHNMSSG